MADNNIGSRIKRAWNVFRNKDPVYLYDNYGSGYSYRPDNVRSLKGVERSIQTSIINKIAMDAAAIDIKHIRLDKDNRFSEIIDSDLNYCLNIEANIDQTAYDFKLDIYTTMLTEGHVCVVPVETEKDPTLTESYKIYSLRTGIVKQWFPYHVRVNVYNEFSGKREDVLLEKKMVAIVQNPLYSVMNEPNSTMQRLVRKLMILDNLDEQSNSNKLDLIIQLPYSIKSELRQKQADERLKAIEEQMTTSKYGIAYIDSTEHVTQLNRSVENKLMGQIEYLTSMLHSQLGTTQGILDGTADENTMNNYESRTVVTLVNAVVDEMKRKFLSKTARTQLQSLNYFKDPFKLVPVSMLAEIADKFTRNEILSSNEIRQSMGIKPSSDPEADELRNKNLSKSKEEIEASNRNEMEIKEEEEIQNG